MNLEQWSGTNAGYVYLSPLAIAQLVKLINEIAQAVGNDPDKFRRYVYAYCGVTIKPDAESAAPAAQGQEAAP